MRFLSHPGSTNPVLTAKKRIFEPARIFYPKDPLSEGRKDLMEEKKKNHPD